MRSKARSRVRVNGRYCGEFGVGVGVHQGSVLSLLLFIRVLEALSREFRTGVPWELLYADDLVFIADTQEECISKLKAWKAGMESKGIRVNMKKTKFLVSDDGQDVFQKSGKYPCAVCCSGVGRNSILCSQCMLWVHKTCSGINVWSKTQTVSALVLRMSLGPAMAELWLKWKSMAPCLMWKPLSATLVICCVPVGVVTVPLLPDAVWPGKSVQSGNVYVACSAMLHGRETWVPTEPELRQLRHNARAMTRWICGIKDRDETSSASLLQKLDIEDIMSVVRCRRLRWYGHIQRATSCIKSITTFLIPGSRKKGRPPGRHGLNVWRRVLISVAWL